MLNSNQNYTDNKITLTKIKEKCIDSLLNEHIQYRYHVLWYWLQKMYLTIHKCEWEVKNLTVWHVTYFFFLRIRNF